MRLGHIMLGLFLILVSLPTGLPVGPLVSARLPVDATRSSPLASTQASSPTRGLAVLVPDGASPPVPDALPGTGRETLVEWWNTNYDYRRKVVIVEPDIASRVMEPVNVYLAFTDDRARQEIIAVAYWDLVAWHEVPSQVWNATTHNTGGTNFYNSCTVCFLVNITRNHEEVFYIYYDDTYSTPRTYTDHITALAANGPTTDDSTMPWVYSTLTSTNYTNVDTVYIRSSASSNESAAILLTDMIRDGSDWGGPSCALITARYGNANALDTANGTTNGEFMLLGEFALDPLGVDPTMASSAANRANVAPDNPAEAWVDGAGVWILDDGPLFTRVKIITSDGGYCNSGSPWCNETSDTVNRGGNGAAGFLNYTITYTFYWHGNNLLANIVLDIQANPQWTNAECHVKNYGDWPHVMTFTCSGTPGTVDAVQNQKAWNGMLKGLYNDSADARRHDFPLEPWTAWYDDSTQAGYDGVASPSLGMIAKTDPLGWELVSLVVTGVGDNLMLQQILREGHQGDFYVMPTGEHFVYDYTVFTSAYGTTYTDVRAMSDNVNNPTVLSTGTEEFYRHNVLTCYTKDVANANVSSIAVHVYNGTGQLARSGTTAAASVLFDRLEDGSYTIVSNYTLISTYAGSVTFCVNVTTIQLDHIVSRGWTRTIRCALSWTTVRVVDWYNGGSLATFAEVFLDNATSGNPVFALNATLPSNLASTYLPPDDYDVSVRYIQRFRTNNQTTPMIVSSNSNTNVIIGIVAREHRAELLLKAPATIPYLEVFYNSTSQFVVYYHDLDDDVGIDVSATSVPYNATWTLANSTHPNIDSGVLVPVPGQLGNYTMTFDASSYLVNDTYQLRFFMDANARVDYWQAYLAVSILIKGREVRIVPEHDSYSVFWNYTFTFSVYLNDTAENKPILGSSPGYFGVGFSGTLLPNGTDGWYSATMDVGQLTAGTYTITIKAQIAAYEDATRQILLYVAPQPTESTIIGAQTSDQSGTIIRGLDPDDVWVPIGDLLLIALNYTGYWNQSIPDATGSISFEIGIFPLENLGNGLYRAVINTSIVPLGPHSASIVLSRQNLAPGIVQMSFEVRIIPAELTVYATIPAIANETYLNLWVGEVASISVYLNDTWHNLPVSGATLYANAPALGIFSVPLTEIGGGVYILTGLSVPFDGIYDLIISGSAANHASVQLSLQLRVQLTPIVRYAATIGAVAAIIGMLVLGGWFAYVRVFSIPWLVRKMRGMSKTLGKGKTPSLSQRERHKIATRPDQMSSVLHAAYDGANIPFVATAVPVAVSIAERDAEDKAIWAELDKLEGLGPDQKLELFEHMKRIPPQDRVWFLEDLKKQITVASARAGRTATAKKAPKPSDDAQIMRRLDTIPTLSAEEKAALLKQIRGLPPDEREEVFKTLQEQAKAVKK